jgi:uncharacterized protein (UPF0276 family)
MTLFHAPLCRILFLQFLSNFFSIFGKKDPQFSVARRRQPISIHRAWLAA